MIDKSAQQVQEIEEDGKKHISMRVRADAWQAKLISGIGDGKERRGVHAHSLFVYMSVTVSVHVRVCVHVCVFVYTSVCTCVCTYLFMHTIKAADMPVEGTDNLNHVEEMLVAISRPIPRLLRQVLLHTQAQARNHKYIHTYHNFFMFCLPKFSSRAVTMCLLVMGWLRSVGSMNTIGLFCRISSLL